MSGSWRWQSSDTVRLRSILTSIRSRQTGLVNGVGARRYECAAILALLVNLDRITAKARDWQHVCRSLYDESHESRIQKAHSPAEVEFRR